MNLTAWREISRTTVIDSPYLKVRKETVELPSGRIYDEYYVTERPGWVAIFCLTKEGKVLLNRQYKHGIRQIVTELPAGGLSVDETPLEAARREFEEETGYKAGDIHQIGKFIIDPTGCDGWVYLFFTSDVSIGQKVQDDKEQIDNCFVTISELRQMLNAGEINVASQVALIEHTLRVKNLS